MQKTTENNLKNVDENVMLLETEKENYITLQKAICIVKKDFSFQDAIECWHKERKFRFRTEQEYILVRDGDEICNRIFYKFFPLWSKEQKKQELIKNGFYSVPIDFKIDWQQNKLYKDILDDVFNQFIIECENPHGYYIYGNIGVGKTTLLTSIAKILKTFLAVELRYITMTRLVRLITSIDFDDKMQIKKIENSCVLFIDDLGIEKYTTDTQEAFMRDFFAYRYGNGFTNIIAGNIDIRTQQKKNSFFRQLADYINDSKQYKTFEMIGKSKRI